MNILSLRSRLVTQLFNQCTEAYENFNQCLNIHHHEAQSQHHQQQQLFSIPKIFQFCLSKLKLPAQLFMPFPGFRSLQRVFRLRITKGLASDMPKLKIYQLPSIFILFKTSSFVRRSSEKLGEKFFFSFCFSRTPIKDIFRPT